MNERWVTLGGAVLALVLATGLLFPRLRPAAPPVSRPTSQDAGEQGLLGAYRWLQGSGLAVARLRTRYSDLPRLAPAATGNLLVISEPLLFPVRRTETEALTDWVERGNAVLLLRADAAKADWAVGLTGPGVLPAFKLQQSGVGKYRAHICQVAQPDKGDETEAPKRGDIPLDGRIRLLPSPADSAYPILAGVRWLDLKPTAAARQRGYPGEFAYTESAGQRLIFVWLCDTAWQRTALWQFRYGQGQVWISSYAELFANANLGRGDNARLLANLVAFEVGPGGTVLFDDMHHGDSALYDPSALFADSRLHASLGLLCAIWLVYLLGYSNRFTAPAAPLHGITPAAFARSVGGFYARSVNARDAAQALIARFHVEVRRRLKRPGTDPAWELLERTPGVDHALLQALRREQAQIDALRDTPKKYPRDLRRLATLIHQLRESLR